MAPTPFPKIVALDTDYTLFEGWLNDSFGKGAGAVQPAEDNLEPEGEWKIKDRSNPALAITLYKDVPGIIHDILLHGADIAIVARNDNKNLVDRALWYFKAEDKSGAKRPITDLVKYDEVYNQSKTAHFGKIHTYSKVDYSDMILFDDDAESNEVRHMLGVTFQVTRDSKGLTWEKYRHGIDVWKLAKSIRYPYLGQDRKLYPNAGFIGYTGVDEATLQLLVQGKTRIDTEESARWGYAIYIADDPAMANFFAEWIKGDTFGPQAETHVCEVWARDMNLWKQVPKIWYPEAYDHQTDNKHWNAWQIAWRQEDRDDWIEKMGVKRPYVLFSRHHWMEDMPIPQGQRFNEMVVYRQVQDALLLTIPLKPEQVVAKIKGGYKAYHELVKDWNIVVPPETREDSKSKGENLFA
ncbi:acid phosphatase-domain-containing protein [Cristinia sonorae]|uniref:Acid phosphatase-domain-containing protein n=1 Tax=Cristinia sonorae TaxID=1940300 RepID=A0A8K0UXH8_9AGAR|nr:acid phosphatase-domain-containing protein [Cristinia sonorae]